MSEDVKFWAGAMETASCYLGYGLHYWLWERPTVAYARHAAVANNLKANRKDKMSFYNGCKSFLHIVSH